MARPNVLQLSPLSNLQAYASASASASSSPQQVSLLRLLPNTRLSADGQVLDTLEVSLFIHYSWFIIRNIGYLSLDILYLFWQFKEKKNIEK